MHSGGSAGNICGRNGTPQLSLLFPLPLPPLDCCGGGPELGLDAPCAPSWFGDGCTASPASCGLFGAGGAAGVGALALAGEDPPQPWDGPKEEVQTHTNKHATGALMNKCNVYNLGAERANGGHSCAKRGWWSATNTTSSTSTTVDTCTSATTHTHHDRKEIWDEIAANTAHFPAPKMSSSTSPSGGAGAGAGAGSREESFKKRRASFSSITEGGCCRL